MFLTFLFSLVRICEHEDIMISTSESPLRSVVCLRVNSQQSLLLIYSWKNLLSAVSLREFLKVFSVVYFLS